MGNPRIFWFMAHIIQFCRMICRRNVATDSRIINKRTENTEGYRASSRENVIVYIQLGVIGWSMDKCPDY